MGGSFKDLKASGDSSYLSFNIDQPIIRNAKYGLTARLGGAYKWIDDDISLLDLNNRRNISNIDLGLFGDWFNQSGSASHQIGINVSSGRLNFKDKFSESLDKSGANTAGSFLKLNILASRMQYFNNNVSLALRADYQASNQNLDSVEKLGIVSISRWRSFSELPSRADTGYSASVELRKNVLAGTKMAHLLLEGISPYVFIDFGRGKLNHKAISNNNHVQSEHFGVGFDAAFKNKWMLNLAVSHQRREFSGARQENDTRAWAQLQKEF